MENAVLRGTRRDALAWGRQVLVGPTSYLTGRSVEEEVFLATGSRVFDGARIGTRSEVRVDGVVHLRPVLPADALVPIGWVAAGDPVRLNRRCRTRSRRMTTCCSVVRPPRRRVGSGPSALRAVR
ncbi:hypothetical protein [Streptomyces sp. NPDC006997]|uniref:hypothetical protein n=1 Tax=Streptomyces sp. NPDC006997 TaxID=3155356 RepID=UPI0033D0840B